MFASPKPHSFAWCHTACGTDPRDWTTRSGVKEQVQCSRIWAAWMRKGLSKHQFVQFVHRLRRKKLQCVYKAGKPWSALTTSWGEHNREQRAIEPLTPVHSFEIPKGWYAIPMPPMDRAYKNCRMAHLFSGDDPTLNYTRKSKTISTRCMHPECKYDYDCRC